MRILLLSKSATSSVSSRGLKHSPIDKFSLHYTTIHYTTLQNACPKFRSHYFIYFLQAPALQPGHPNTSIPSLNISPILYHPLYHSLSLSERESREEIEKRRCPPSPPLHPSSLTRPVGEGVPPLGRGLLDCLGSSFIPPGS